MNTQETKTFEMLTHVADFGAKNVSLFPKITSAAEIVKTLKSGVQKLSDGTTARVSAERAVRTSGSARARARAKLRTCLSRAYQIARALDIGEFRFPVRETEQAIIGACNSFVADIESMKTDFLKHGLPPNDVSSAVENLKEAILNHTAAKETRSAAVKEWRKDMRETLAALRRFDALVSIVLADKPGAMASYSIARSIPSARTRKTAPAVSSNPSPPPVSTTATPAA